jgi:hypothetical protein
MGKLDISSLRGSAKDIIENYQSQLSTYLTDAPIENIADSYFSELLEEAFSDTLERYKEFSQSIGFNRSTYLPIEIIKATKQNEIFSNQENISSKKFLVESYENTFFRMLGMPTDQEVSEYIIQNGVSGEYEIRDDNISIKNVLDQRQTPQIRTNLLSNSVYHISDVSTKNIDDYIERMDVADKEYLELIISQSKNNLVSEDMTEEEIRSDFLEILRVAEFSDFSISELEKYKKINDTYNDIFTIKVLENELSESFKINNIARDYHKTTYLLFPPVQDSRINQCIAESDKLIQRPFLGNKILKFNNEKPKISTLEAVIRIRIDKISGYNPDLVAPFIDNNTKKIKRFDQFQGEDTYGFIESVMTDRMSMALKILCQNLIEDIEDYSASSAYTGLEVVKSNSNENNQEDPSSSAELRESQNEINKNSEEILKNQELLNTVKSIDDNLKILLSSNEIINIQENTFRTSSVSKGQFMSVVNDIVTVPGNLASKKLNELRTENVSNAKSSGGPDEIRAKISQKIGIGKGVGLIDLISFVLSMFLVDEQYLIGLLNEEQFKELKKQYPTFNFFAGFKKPPLTESLNAYTETVISVYELAKEFMSDDDNDVVG